MVLKIGPWAVESPLVLAPMAGVTDVPYRRICRRMGAGLTVAEMAASDAHLRESAMTQRRTRADADDPLPVVQLLGADPKEMARAAELAQQGGARIIDINFGCPARMVCGKACGSAIMRDPELARRIMHAVRQAVSVPVTVKMRIGWDEAHKNAVDLARAAQDEGLAAVTVHGRTRAARFTGRSDRGEIARVVRAVSIPVVANGDVAEPGDAVSTLEETGAAGVMIGRGAYGNPWIFRRARALLAGKADPGLPARSEVGRTVLEHFDAHMEYWVREEMRGETEELLERARLAAVRSFRKHARWYMTRFAREEDAADARLLEIVVRTDSSEQARAGLVEFFES
ncbi:MAG: tRNA dihydrouridine synthase DusB [Duodenibacillus sp.]